MLDVEGEVSLLGLTPGQATLGCKEADTDSKPQSLWEGAGMQPGHAAGDDVGSGMSLKCKIVRIKGAEGPASSMERS